MSPLFASAARRAQESTGAIDEFLHHSTLPEDARDPPECTRSSVLICARTGVLSDEHGRKWRLHEYVAVDTFTFDGVLDTLEQLATPEYCHGQFHGWVVDEVDHLTPSQWRTLITTHEACPRVFENLAGGEAQFSPLAWMEALPLQKRLHTQNQFDERSRSGRLCSSVRVRHPSERDIDFIVEGEVHQNAEDEDITALGVQRFADQHPMGVTVAIQVDIMTSWC